MKWGKLECKVKCGFDETKKCGRKKKKHNKRVQAMPSYSFAIMQEAIITHLLYLVVLSNPSSLRINFIHLRPHHFQLFNQFLFILFIYFFPFHCQAKKEKNSKSKV
jgi:hypothetical protein